MTIKKPLKKNASEIKTKVKVTQKAAPKKITITAAKNVSKKAKKSSDNEVSATELSEDSSSDFSLPWDISVQNEKDQL